MHINEHKPGACKLLQHEFKSNLGVYNSVSASTFNSHECQKKSMNEEKNLVSDETRGLVHHQQFHN
jgi:hypothetical protein